MPLIELIDKAVAAAGSQVKLAEKMGVKQQEVSSWRTGKRYCTTPTRIELCKIADYDLKVALLMLGLLDAAEAAIAAMPEGSDKRAAQIEYEADTWERHNPFLSALWAQLGGTSESLDAAFLLAVTL